MGNSSSCSFSSSHSFSYAKISVRWSGFHCALGFGLFHCHLRLLHSTTTIFIIIIIIFLCHLFRLDVIIIIIFVFFSIFIIKCIVFPKDPQQYALLDQGRISCRYCV